MQTVSVLFNEPKLLKCGRNCSYPTIPVSVSVLFNEPKLLKSIHRTRLCSRAHRFSALQRAEIAEICTQLSRTIWRGRFSALQRAEIAEMWRARYGYRDDEAVSVLFNEPKLLKYKLMIRPSIRAPSFSALQRAEIAEIQHRHVDATPPRSFQCSSTSRNC